MASKARFVVVYRAAGRSPVKYRWAAYDRNKCIGEGVYRSYKWAALAARNMLRHSRTKKNARKKK
jgi:hypothetical protein